MIITCFTSSHYILSTCISLDVLFETTEAMRCFSSSLLLTCAETFLVWDVLVGVMRSTSSDASLCAPGMHDNAVSEVDVEFSVWKEGKILIVIRHNHASWLVFILIENHCGLCTHCLSVVVAPVAKSLKEEINGLTIFCQGV